MGVEVTEATSPEQVFARQLRVWREKRNITAQQLADRMDGKLSRQAISKIENGDRRVTLDELVGLAAALDVPPLLLALPIGRQPTVELLPGRIVPTWDAAKWWMGELDFKGTDGAGSSLLGYFRDHDQLLMLVIGNRQAETGVIAEHHEERLRDLRKNMRRASILPPELPADLADIDQEEGQEDGRPDQAD